MALFLFSGQTHWTLWIDLRADYETGSGIRVINVLAAARSQSDPVSWHNCLAVDLAGRPRVRHSNGDPVLTATVSGSWSEGANGSASCDTDATGQCELVKQNVKSNVASVKLSITGVTHPSLTYDESENPPEIGNTPVITVIKP